MAQQTRADQPADRWISLFRFYVVDWVLLIVLAILTIGLEALKPFQRYVGAFQLTALMYPLTGDLIPNWAVPIIGVLLPLAVLLFFFFVRKDKRDFHQALLGLLYTIVFVALITDTLKNRLGRPRPDFFWRCFPNGVAAYGDEGNVACTGEGSVVREGFKSFPSGHSSWSFGGLTYTSLYLAGKLKALGGRSHLWGPVAAGLPLVAAAAVVVTRIDNYMHFWTDVLAGSVLGIVLAWIFYFQLYPPLTSPNCDAPHISQGNPWRPVEAGGERMHLPL